MLSREERPGGGRDRVRDEGGVRPSFRGEGTKKEKKGRRKRRERKPHDTNRCPIRRGITLFPPGEEDHRLGDVPQFMVHCDTVKECQHAL
jgi:hypothetical protein